ncbi:MAG: Stp1/IreP family PP2C-type Ser/Thr phosphatase [Gammaproteobacteria bacterium]|nr:Stp1/IreP family PP2C-type Ser/Thr phosphatase [Gammaproteobacteria bacterium]
MDMTGRVEIANCSNVGQKRPHNEDSTASDESLGLAVLADGMGGYKAGEVASAIAVTTIMHEVKNGLRRFRHGQLDSDSGYRNESLLLRNAVARANESIFRVAQSETVCRGMGTTVVVVLFYNDRVSIAHVGDSRLYRLRGETLRQMTSDHSLIQELVNRGLYSRAEATANTPKNLVTRALGIESTVEIDILEDNVQEDDIYLLCSDGLNDMVDDEEIRLTLRKYSANLVQAAQELVRLANKKGGKDNISVILARKSGPTAQDGGITRKLLDFFS